MQQNNTYARNAVLTCIKVIVDSECQAEDELKSLSGKFLVKLGSIDNIRTIIQELAEKMSPKERVELQKFAQ